MCVSEQSMQYACQEMLIVFRCLPAGCCVREFYFGMGMHNASCRRGLERGIEARSQKPECGNRARIASALFWLLASGFNSPSQTAPTIRIAGAESLFRLPAY